VHLLLVNTPSPANVMVFYKTLIPIVTFELFPTFSFFQKYMGDLNYENGYSSTFELFEYDILYLLPLLGFMLITLLLIPVSLILSSIGSKFTCNNGICKAIKNKSEKTKSSLLWNGILGIFYNGYIVYAICCACNFWGDLPNTSVNEKINLYSTYAMIGGLIIPFPIFVLVFYCACFKRLGEENF
jgi:hypothetical protein